MERVFVTGRVTDNKDPENLGRLKVELHGFKDPIETPWLRAVMPHASGEEGGFVFLPAVDDEVVCLSPVYGPDADQGQLSSMIVLGCLYNGNAPPKFDGDDPDEPVKRIQTSSGHQVVFDDKKLKVMVRAADDNTSVLLEGKDTKVTITAGSATVTINKDKAGSIDIDAAGGKLTLNAAQGISLKSAAKVEIKAPSVAVNGAKIDLTGAGQVGLTGAMINLSGMTNLG